MSTQHAPGPWALEDRGYKYIVSKPGDGYITRDVCRMDGSTMAAFSQEANARLIAAAPELLEVADDFSSAMNLLAMRQGLSVLEIARLLNPIGDKARAAIAKATGNN